jgi:hypothetical protein
VTPLDQIQRGIETLNGVESPCRAEDFLVAGQGRETLYVCESPAGLDVGLHLAPEVLAGLRSEQGATLDQFCAAAEGISHFVYFTLRANASLPVSQLELEAQAEVDKYALLVLHFWRRRQRKESPRLRERLFELFRLREGLDAVARARYLLANRLAHAYARFLETRFVFPGDHEGLFAELRRFYRLGAAEKLTRMAWAS